jgi:hypothetical protein
MEHEVWFDESNEVMHIKVVGDFTVEDVTESTRQMEQIMADKGNCPLIVDLRDAPPTLDKDVRRILKEQADQQEVAKTAMIVTNPAVRMMGKVVTSAMGRGKTTGFFKTPEDALVWLKGDAKR